ncbi:DUF5994 family protein [Mycobacterium colombiense]|uniref:DUF5994 family protein n=1 Tax=Mycobacterium colombiense TaxID=339268 RepID=UPI0020A2B2B3|nr:DUF5994 family protein [Mycobacterium colombiense]
MNRADPLFGLVAREQNPMPGAMMNSIGQRRAGTADPDEVTPMRDRGSAAAWPIAPLRLTLASRLGNKIDGAWWPRTGLVSRELPDLVSVLEARLGQVVDINVNWSSLQGQRDLNFGWLLGVHPQVMTVIGRDARAALLLVPYRTATALAVMILRRAAGLPVYPIHHDSRAFKTAECIVRAAQGESMIEVRRRVPLKRGAAAR